MDPWEVLEPRPVPGGAWWSESPYRQVLTRPTPKQRAEWRKVAAQNGDPLDPFFRWRPRDPPARVPRRDIPVFAPEALELVAATWRERVRVNRAAVRPLLVPADVRASGKVRWARVSEATGIPVRLLKMWWWGAASMSQERTACLRRHVVGAKVANG